MIRTFVDSGWILSYNLLSWMEAIWGSFPQDKRWFQASGEQWGCDLVYPEMIRWFAIGSSLWSSCWSSQVHLSKTGQPHVEALDSHGNLFRLSALGPTADGLNPQNCRYYHLVISHSKIHDKIEEVSRENHLELGHFPQLVWRTKGYPRCKCS